MTAAGFEAAGARQFVPVTIGHCGLLHAQLGLFDEGREILERIIAAPDSGDLAVRYALFYKSMLLVQTGQTESALAIAENLSQVAIKLGDHVMCWNARLVSIECLLEAARLDDAEQALNDLRALVVNVPYLHARHLSLLALLRQNQGQLDEAVRLSAEAIIPWRLGPRYHYGEDPILLRHAEALRAQGDMAGSRRAIQDARDDLLVRASKVPDVDMRRAFIDNVPHRRRTMELAREWLDRD
jgi:tetratricopeptide (TPR) repeat protein